MLQCRHPVRALRVGLIPALALLNIVHSAPAILLASSRSRGNTTSLIETAFPSGNATVYDISALQIGYYAYDESNADDDFLPLIDNLLLHSTWIIATPLYWYTMSAQAKTFIDRLSDLTTFNRPIGRTLRGKSMAVLCSGTDPSLPDSFNEPFRLTCDYLGMQYIGSHYARYNGQVLQSPAAASRKFALDVAGCEG